MADRITSIYKKACTKGILNPETQSEDWFREQLSSEKGIKSFYDHATANGMKFHPYPEFKERLTQPIETSQPTQPAQGEQTAQPLNPSVKANPTPTTEEEYQANLARQNLAQGVATSFDADKAKDEQMLRTAEAMRRNAERMAQRTSQTASLPQPELSLAPKDGGIGAALERTMEYRRTEPHAIADRMIRNEKDAVDKLYQQEYQKWEEGRKKQGVLGDIVHSLKSAQIGSPAPEVYNEDPYIKAAQHLLLQAENRMKDTKKGQYQFGDFTGNTLRHLLESQEGVATFGLSDVSEALALSSVFKKLDNEKALDDPASVLNEKEMALYNAYTATLAAEFARRDDTSAIATAGKISADMVQFVEEMVLQGGIWGGVNSAVRNKLARYLTGKIVQKASGKVAHGFAKAGAGLIMNTAERGMLAGETAVTSLLLPRTYAQMINNQIGVPDNDDALQFDGYKLRIGELEQHTTGDAFMKAWGNQWKEMFTETGGLFRFGTNMVFKNPLTRTVFNKLGKTKFGSVLDSVNRGLNKAFPKYAKTVAYDGVLQEWTEEAEAAGWDYLFGDKKAFKNFFTKEQQLPMLISFSLPALFGTGVNAGSEIYFKNKYDNAFAGLRTTLEANGYDNNDIDEVLADIKDNLYASNVEDLPKTIQGMAESILGADAVKARNRFATRYDELAERKNLTKDEKEEMQALGHFLQNDKTQMLIDCLTQLAGAETALAQINVQNEKERNIAIERARQAERDYGQRPIGTNDWGAVYDWTNRTPQEGAEFLRAAESGYLKNVFHNDKLGDIDLTWGHYGAGLQKMIEKHIVRYSDYETVEELMAMLENLISNYEPEINENGRYEFSDGKYIAVITPGEDGNFVLTSYDRVRKSHEKERTQEEQEVKRKELGITTNLRPDETADGQAEEEQTLPSTESSGINSDDKGTNNFSNTQILEQKKAEYLQQATQEIQNFTHQDGNVYEVTQKGNGNKHGYMVGSVSPEYDANTGMFNTKDVVTVKWDDGTVDQCLVRDLDIVQAPATAQEVIGARAEQLLAQYAAEQQEALVDFVLPDNSVLHLRQTGDGVYENTNPNADGTDALWTADDLAMVGAQALPKEGQPLLPNEGQAPVQQPTYPTDESGNPAWSQMKVPQASQVLYDLYQGNREGAKAYADDALKEAEKVQKALAKRASHNLNIAERLREEEQIKQERAAADATVKYWQNVKLAVAQMKTAEEIAAEEAKRAKDSAAAAARRQTEDGLSGGQPAEKWNKAQRVEGNAVTRTLPDGTKISGHYVLTEAGAATPSHDPFNNWNTSEGFPVTEDGRNINDRDYKNDKEAQQITMQIAQTYDGQAVEQVPVVSSEGIVYDGNGRTIAGHIAAANNTDAAYIQSLTENAANFGFTPEQLAQFNHPRVYFQTDEDLPYNTTTFAKFNAQEKKTQSSVNRAISSGKKLSEAARDGILRIIDSYNSLDAFFSSEAGAKDVINMLMNNGIITQQEVPEWKEDTDRGFVLSANGRSAVTDLLIGALFDEQTIRMLGNDKGLKASILRAMPSIVENSRMGEYALTDNITEAIRLLYEARQADMAYKLFVLQGNIVDGYVKDRFSAFAMLMAEEMSAGVEQFRQVLNLYNNSAREEAENNSSLFERRTPEEIKNQILERYGKEIQEPTQPAEPAEPARPATDQTQPPAPSAPAGNGAVEENNNIVPERPNLYAKLASAAPSDNRETTETSAEQEQPTEPLNTIFTDEAYAAAKARMKARLNRLNMGLDPEMIADQIVIAGYHVERGARKFADFARALIVDFGDGIRKYARQMYNYLRDIPEGDSFRADMDDYATVMAFDIDNFDANTAENGTEVVQSTINEENNVNNSPENLQESEKNSTFAGENNNDNGNTEENSGRVPQTGTRTSGRVRSEQGELGEGNNVPSAVALGELLKGKSAEEQHKLAAEWAKEQGILVDFSNYARDNGFAIFANGNENDNWLDTQNGIVYKMNNLMHSADKISNLIERVELYNEIFPETKLSLWGFSNIYGSRRVHPIYTQHIIYDAEHATVEQIDDFMRSKGFEPTGKEGEYSNGEYIVSDAKPKNVLVAPNGAVYVVDAEAKRAGQGGGGKKATFEKGQKVKYKQWDAVVEDVNRDGTYNLSYPNALGINTQLIGISDKDIQLIATDQPKTEQKENPFQKQFKAIKEQYPDAVLLFRMGDFYELYDVDAVEGSKILGITLTHNTWAKTAGFPFHALDTYLPKLVRAGKRVAICDQLEDPKLSKKLAKRGLSELENPGTPYQEPAPAAEPEPQQVVTDTIGEITESKHTKTGAPIWVVKPLERVSDEEFRVLRRRAKENNGYYSTFVRGYVFNSVNDATRFNNISDEQTTTEQTSADSEAAISTGEATERETASIGRDRGNQSRAERKQRTAGTPAGVGAVGTVTPQEQPVSSPEEANAAIEERQEAIGKIDEATKQIENQLDKLEQPEESAEEQTELPTDPTINDLVEQAKQRRATSRKKKAYDQQQLDLFAEEDNNPPLDEQTEPINNEDNGSTEVRDDGQRESRPTQGRTAGQPADQNGTLGGGEQQTDERPGTRGVGSGSEQHRVHDGERGLGTAGQRTNEPVEEPVAESERRNKRNFRYNPSDLAPTGNRARYDANIAAIRLLKQLQDEGRQATPEEQRTLAKFTGWGGLGEFFKGMPGTTYYAQNGEQSPYDVIKSLLTAEELEAAQLSRNSAYYTPAVIIDQLWNIAKKLGFRGGNILEGSAGIGNILAQMPQSISDRSNIQAVEIDDITAGILAQLYPDATTHATGFEKVDLPNNSQDLVITNVPFVTGLRVHDKQERDLSKRFGNIHDFCIAKNVRKLRQGGIGIFITSNGTLDNSKDLRRWLNNEGETDVIGAFRMNRETFGGTSVTSDIIVVRKRVNGEKVPNPIDVLDTETARTAYYEEDGKEVGRKLVYNRYFVEHPENMGGEMGFGFEHGDTRWGGTTAGCYPSSAINQTQRMQDWIESLENSIHVPTYNELEKGALVQSGTYEEYEGAVPYGSLILNSKGEICRAYHGMAIPVEGINTTKVKGRTKAEVLKDYNAIKAAVEELLTEQAKGISDESMKPLLRKLNRAYDDFVKKYGNLNRNTSLSFLRNDVQWASIAALENVRETVDASGKKKVEVSKTDVFSKRVVGIQPEPKAENAKDGIILSVQQYGNVRPDRIAVWLGKSQEEVEKEIIESRLAFRDPQTGNMVVSHEYLSGNVREKLAYAEAHNEGGIYDTNIEELRKVIPIDIPAHLIEFNIGSTWIPVELYHEYLKEKFGVETLQLTHVGSAWMSNEKSYGGYALRNEKNRSEGVYSELLHEQVYGHQLMMAAMNNVPLVVSKVEKHYDGTTETVTDKEASAACSDKISQIKDDFVEWARGKMQQDSELAERVQKIYNERFNAVVPMLRVDEAFLSPHLPGQNSDKYDLYNHQQQAVVRATTQPIMLAHEVGTGKTITLISAAMEMRRLGTAKKPMIVVQNATTPQFVKEAKDLYPNAKILTVSERDRTREGRQEFYAKIKYNDWDLIIVPQSVFDMIPDSEARMRDFIQEKIEEKMHAIEAAKEANVDEKVTKRMERELDALREDLENANMSGKRSKSKTTEKDEKKAAEQRANAAARAEEMLDRRTDEVEDFDDMGIDALLIDEAHNYKHLGFATMMSRGVKGIDPSYSKRAAALYLKCQSIYERKGHRNVVFATGTPISNTAAEVWTFMKYLMPKEVLKDNDIYYFDDFVHNFGKIAEQLEFATNGKFKANNRFAQYGNVPELMRLWLTCADCVLTREVGQVNDKVPELEGGKAQDIFLPQSPSLIDIMAAVRAELERYEEMSGKEKKENSHIPLTMYGVAKRAAIDPRLVDANAADEPLSKTNRAVEETLRSLKETKKYNGTVAIFCDAYRNLQSGFNLFEDIKAKLVKKGVPAAKIAIIRSEMTDAAKQKVFDAVREGEIRVIMGSTQTLGTGVNIQTRLHTLIHMDAPDRPMDYTQRNGRIVRQGNMHRQWNIPVRVLRFGVEDSLDVTSYQRLKTKAGFIDSIMNGKGLIDNNLENRVLEDVEEGIFDNPVAMLSGSQFALLKTQAERDLRKWSARKQQHDIDQILIAKKLKENARIIEYRRQLITTDEQFLGQLQQTFPDGKVTEYNINGTVCRNATELKEALKATNADIQAESDNLRKHGYEGEKRNIALALTFNGMPFNVNIVLTYKSSWKEGQRMIGVDKEMQYTTPTSDTWLGSPTKVLDKLIEKIEQNYLSGTQAQGEITYSRNYIERLQQENELMRQREGKPFAHQEELDKARALVEEYTTKMQAELAEKEAKYANMESGRKVTINEQEDEDDTTPEAQYDELGYDAANLTEAQQLATDALIEALNDNTDLEVAIATDEEIEVQKKSLSETATWSELMLRTNNAADISSNDGAKILQKIETTKQKLENSSNLTIKDPISVLSHAIGLQKTGLSYYGTFKTGSGNVVTLRISNHNATISNFDNEGEKDGVSIVITSQPSIGIKNDGRAHVVEYFYRKKDLSEYYGKPFADILGSIKTLLETGEYTDTTGLAIREEVNIPELQIVNHNSPYLLKKADGSFVDPETGERLGFDHRFMSKGEGGQAHGWGSYFSVNDIRAYAEGNISFPYNEIKVAFDASVLNDGSVKESVIEEWLMSKVRRYYERAISERPSSFRKWLESQLDHAKSIVSRYEGMSFEDEVAALSRQELAILSERRNDVREISTILEAMKKDITLPRRHHYSVEIPENDGTNYIEEDKPLTDEQFEMWKKALLSITPKEDREEKEKWIAILNRKALDGGSAYYKMDGSYSSKKASKALNKAGFVGIHYNGRRDGECYVIFNENDAKIIDHREFMLTPNGRLYGWAVGNQVRLTKDGLNPNTPIHEYTHLWAKAMRRNNPEGWQSIVNIFRDTPLWQEVKNDANYQGLTTADAICSEVLARYSGQRGAARMEEMAEELLHEARESASPLQFAKTRQLINRVKKALSDFWQWVGTNLFGIKHFDSAEQVADRVLFDMLNQTELDITAEQEMLHIKERAIADGTFMQAPNGKRTNLTERQWLQVRTRAFKRWFGDWEKRAQKSARIEKLRSSKDAVITGNEIAISDIAAEQRRLVKEYVKAHNLQGEYTNADTGSVIQLQHGRKNGGVMELLQHDFKDAEHIQSIAAIPQIIENSIYIDSEENHDKGKNPNVAEYQYYVCGLKIGGEDYTVRSTIAVDRNGNRYYDHKLTHIEKGKLLDLSVRVTNPARSQAEDGNGSITNSERKDTKLFSILQINPQENAKISQIVDENGEPMVVYHATPEQFTKFDIERSGRNTGDAWYGKGFYFSEMKQDLYGKNVMPVFLNIRKPIDITDDKWDKFFNEHSDEFTVGYKGFTYKDLIEETKGKYNYLDLLEKYGLYKYLPILPPKAIDVRGQLRRVFDKYGYNGVIAETSFPLFGNEYVAFSPNQIKSATNNNGDFSEDEDNIEAMISGYTPEKTQQIRDWYAAHPNPQYQKGEGLDHFKARLDAWKEEQRRFREQMNEGRPSVQQPEAQDRPSNAGAPAFVPGVRPTPLANETAGEYAQRLKQYYQLMRDERLVAEYVAHINAEADAAAKVLKRNTLVRGLIDAAKPIENFQEWMKERGAIITDESNAYTDTFLATGRVTDANERLIRDIIRPLAKQIGTIIAPDKTTGKSRLEGLNFIWQNMDEAGTGRKIDGTALTPREIIGVYCQAKDCAEAIEEGLPDRGAAGFVNNVGIKHDDIIAVVESVIPAAELDKMWDLIRKATHYALEYDHEAGRISDDTFEEFSKRQYYVPQRGWRERDESGLITDYEPVGKRGNDPYNAALVRARGRKTLASDPFAYIMSIDASSIVSSENNKIKQKFLRFCLDNEDLGLKTGAFRVKKYWIMNVIDPATGKIQLDEEGNPMMEVSYVAPTAEDFEHDKTAKAAIKELRKAWSKVNRAMENRRAHDELPETLETAYQNKLRQIEQRIEELEQTMHIAWNATNTHITQRTSDEKKQHEVRILMDGQEYVIELQDEKLANAINKKFKQHQEQLFNTSSRMRNATRFMSAMLTQYNPEFAASNFVRDYQVALATLTAEHPELVGAFMKNFAACQGSVWQYAWNDKVKDRESFRRDEMGRYLQEYLQAGAATGFSYMQDLKSLRQDFDKMVNEGNMRRGIKGAVGVFSMLTEVSETAVRFAGYVSARKAGMGVNDAAYLSKELTTNFDRAGEVADSGWMSWFSFFRATLNGNVKFLKALKKMPLAYSLVAAAYVALGMLNQFLNPDDPEDEVWASDYTRQSNFVVGKIRIPTAHFMRMFFSAGVNLAQWMQGTKTFGHAVYNTADFASQELLPDYINLFGNGTEWNNRTGRVDFSWTGLVQGAMPTPISPIADVYFNRDFRGATINREPFAKSQEGMKDILRAKDHTLPIYKWLTQTVYEGTGGNMNTKYQSDDPAWRSWLFDTSASSVEHIAEGYMPAGMDLLITTAEAIYDAATGTPTGPEKWPFLRKFYNAYTPERAYTQQYYLLKGQVDEYKRNLDDYRKNDRTKYNRLRASGEYDIYLKAKKLVDKGIDNPTTADVKEIIKVNKQWLKK